ncbi:regulatory helix-turn-helix LysR family protein [Pseudaminobacter salicylatoxidans]|uniref:Regulatory helix-turn-helix LysR family protein n=1 Tax=Pseudaminobacter salicylatoxidans TaxID=93369 RepID=A0A316C496_PSESE|nr:LysR family transcriptional regulator [Pseudaminobacter salicylatoxidans]PWJ84565.1 regulatory helix-turn-helix LysR family protein [Pseudaminobacter salicylatoxidans]
MAQSSGSARVKALEGDLGVLLFARHARGVRLTEAGRHFIKRVWYRENHPGIDVEITEGTAGDAVMQLRAERLAVAFGVGRPELPHRSI